MFSSTASRMSLLRERAEEPQTDARRARFVFLLMADFSMLSLVSAVETLRAANCEAGEDYFDWSFCSESGRSVRSSLNLRIDVNMGLESLNRNDTIIVCGSSNIREATSTVIVQWLRREARKGLAIGGLFTAGYTLAKAGLLQDKRATIHWENHDIFTEAFPEVELSNDVFVVDDNRYTTAGGTAAIDLMLELLAEMINEDLSARVASHLNYSSIRSLQKITGVSAAHRKYMRHPKLARAIHIIEKNLESPIGNFALAARSGVSKRQLERLFQQYIGQTPRQFYMDLRLRRAHNLLLQSNLPVIEVGLASGFVCSSHFAKVFRAMYGFSPSELRRRQSPLASDSRSLAD